MEKSFFVYSVFFHFHQSNFGHRILSSSDFDQFWPVRFWLERKKQRKETKKQGKKWTNNFVSSGENVAGRRRFSQKTWFMPCGVQGSGFGFYGSG